ncbi:hypothetical protein [Tuwongella immobilis]|uniref:Carboxypeptidase regulatory-like domain-containing protein n=1 Tax=Tuwongella immobilis TaxID=692036 RepID=A0A6C2YTH6_9BACT|nr:hypothetical protein [Tuwongella immobilis]VIP04776.1 Uncharacterized protein OS=Pirellula staleyi (strain ATCC 27377 / DSM 6068 / ICPB 4128) GN=Psta_0693 PE=4 SV=1 [Tuwongella immobilis]VTS06911.1 Uncharacterized protein OS=Pirellula staleyi (strain ATCC 27377 / DSM 6068 / ICPB 4128) GN=Psta_0693 PE=4 SV=1 [Tuwongella immobilis]
MANFKFPRRFLRGFLGLALVFTGTACSQDSRTPVYPVQGELRYRGKPVAGAWVVFHATQGDRLRALKPFGKTDASGAFQLRTYEGTDGAPAAEYAVTVTWPGPIPKGDPDATEGPDQFRGRYADPTQSKWKVRIEPGENRLPRMDLESADRPG